MIPDDYTLAPKNEDASREVFDDFIVVAQDIEAYTPNTAKTVRLLAPSAFVDLWERDEVGHGNVYRAIGEPLGYTFEDEAKTEPDTKIELFGLAVRHNPWARRAGALIVAKHGVINELTNIRLQGEALRRFIKIGEVGMAQIMGHMMYQERLHTLYYQHLLDRSLAGAGPVVRRLTDTIVTRDFKLVGGDVEEREEALRHVVNNMLTPEETTAVVMDAARRVLSPKVLPRVEVGVGRYFSSESMAA
jgi:hypothetical protein